MTYEEALAFLNAPKYSETRPGLGPVTELMHRLGDPQDQLKFEIAQELGLDSKVMESGWRSLTAKESGRIGGILAHMDQEKTTHDVR